MNIRVKLGKVIRFNLYTDYDNRLKFSIFRRGRCMIIYFRPFRIRIF